jgi:radical SAM superfamily enzyme YgiQ (UPF0313 family)
MNIRFIYPRFEKFLESRPELSELSKYDSVGNFKMPPALGIPILSSLTPEIHQCSVVDENLQQIDYSDNADLFAVSFFTPQAEYAYDIARKLRAKGKTVIAGGIHPTMMPEEAAEYFDSVCVGEGEAVWLEILKDAENKDLKNFYYGGNPDLTHLPIPNRSIIKDRDGYAWNAKLMQVMRGCAFSCENCILPAGFGKKYRFRPVEDILKELAGFNTKEFFITDDSIVLNNAECTGYLEKLMKAFSQLDEKPRIYISGSLNMSVNPAYLKSLYEGGVVCVYMVLGCDLISTGAFRKKGKRFFDWSVDIVKKIQDAGIQVFTSHGLGFDYQDHSLFDLSLEFCEKTNIETAEFYILTPFPKTPSWHRFHEENRILHYNWSKYNTANVVFKPRNFTEQELLDGYLLCWKEFYKSRKTEDSLTIFKGK